MLKIILDTIEKKRRFKNPARILSGAEHTTVKWYSRGYHWVSRRIMPALLQLEQSQRSSADTELLVDTLYLLGDHCFMVSAPLAAAQWYQRCLLYEPSFEPAYDDLAGIACSFAEIELVQQIARIAEKQQHPQIEEIKDELDLVSGTKPGDLDPLGFEDSTAHWLAREMLAMGYPRLALASLKGLGDVQALLLRSRIFGAMDELEEVLNVWRILGDSDYELSRIYGADRNAM